MNNLNNSEITLTDQNFLQEVIKSNVPVLVDFWAEWCIPCQMVAPIIAEIADIFNGKIKIGKLNVDHNPSVSAAFEIEAIPTIILFHNQKIIKKFVGVSAKSVIVDSINSVLVSKN